MPASLDSALGMSSSMGEVIMRVAIVIILAIHPGLGCIGQNTPPETSGAAVARFDVTGTIQISRDSPDRNLARRSVRELGRPVVVWLEMVESTTSDLVNPGAYKMIQKDKEFHPGLLVVPVGSTVSFPNADPYFHNVFSLFNGKRFDLGLYQSGQTRNVAFNREGVSYIFCNIHPEMSAVIISLKTPYYAQPDAQGVVTLHGVPQGLYRLQVWSELASPETLRSLSRMVKVDGNNTFLGKVAVHIYSRGTGEHLNKFGLPYDTHSSSPPY